MPKRPGRIPQLLRLVPGAPLGGGARGDGSGGVGRRGGCPAPGPSLVRKAGAAQPAEQLLPEGDVGEGVPNQGAKLQDGEQHRQEGAPEPDRGVKGPDQRPEVEQGGDPAALVEHVLDLVPRAHQKHHGTEAEDVAESVADAEATRGEDEELRLPGGAVSISKALSQLPRTAAFLSPSTLAAHAWFPRKCEGSAEQKGGMTQDEGRRAFQVCPLPHDPAATGQGVGKGQGRRCPSAGTKRRSEEGASRGIN
mmetsp:Transcript_19131/g.45614  ORF Transcript_19131/g.45614 Transcript_19131/m.45614 type:complete len:251 (-) Transcript_19131:1207-1959(-)